jgi:hypothetical protein
LPESRFVPDDHRDIARLDVALSLAEKGADTVKGASRREGIELDHLKLLKASSVEKQAGRVVRVRVLTRKALGWLVTDLSQDAGEPIHLGLAFAFQRLRGVAHTSFSLSRTVANKQELHGRLLTGRA